VHRRDVVEVRELRLGEVEDDREALDVPAALGDEEPGVVAERALVPHEVGDPLRLVRDRREVLAKDRLRLGNLPASRLGVDLVHGEEAEDAHARRRRT
jgi:hypothetical protein